LSLTWLLPQVPSADIINRKNNLPLLEAIQNQHYSLFTSTLIEASGTTHVNTLGDKGDAILHAVCRVARDGDGMVRKKVCVGGPSQICNAELPTKSPINLILLAGLQVQLLMQLLDMDFSLLNSERITGMHMCLKANQKLSAITMMDKMLPADIMVVDEKDMNILHLSSLVSCGTVIKVR